MTLTSYRSRAQHKSFDILHYSTRHPGLTCPNIFDNKWLNRNKNVYNKNHSIKSDQGLFQKLLSSLYHLLTPNRNRSLTAPCSLLRSDLHAIKNNHYKIFRRPCRADKHINRYTNILCIPRIVLGSAKLHHLL